MQKNKNRIYFRVDADDTIGLGHLIRTLALASYLIEEFHCVFVIKKPSSNVLNILKSENLGVKKINKEIDFFNMLNKQDIVVLDGYNYDLSYQIRVKESCSKLVCIDDIFDHVFYCDAIINHAGSVRADDYNCQPYTKLFLGLEFALLRKPFLLASNNKRIINKISSYFICFGGSDNENFTKKTIEQLTRIDNVKKINIVIGGEYQYSDDLNVYCKSINKFEINLYQNLDAKKMVNIILDSHLAIVPSSSILYEALSVSIPIITGYTVDNQKKIYSSLLKKELVLGIGTFPIKNLDKSIEIIKTKKKIMMENQSHFLDGKSGERLLQIFKNLKNE